MKTSEKVEAHKEIATYISQAVEYVTIFVRYGIFTWGEAARLIGKLVSLRAKDNPVAAEHAGDVDHFRFLIDQALLDSQGVNQ